MYLSALHLHNFRVYEDELFQFHPKLNIIQGANASGKTSILEAIFFLMTGRSFRTSQPSDLIRHGALGFHLEALFVKHGIEHKLRISYSGKERKIIFNNTLCGALSDLLGLLPGVVIHPDDANVIKGAPEIRRHLLDLQIAQANPLYVHHLTRYNRAMRQRNQLLRAKNGSTIESWENEMANSAAYLVQQRVRTVDDLQREGRVLHNAICNSKDELGLAYKTGAFSRNESLYEADPLKMRMTYIEHYRKQRPREMELGLTITGPHKDDMLIVLGGKETRFFASEGQQRSCVAAIRLAEWERLKAVSLELPLMLVDDVGMGFDSSRRKTLFSHLTSLGQVFLTATEELPLEGKIHYIM